MISALLTIYNDNPLLIRLRNNRKKGIPCRCMDGHVKEPYEMSMAWEPDRRFNFFFNPPAHICAVTYDWNIVKCDVKQPYSLSLSLSLSIVSNSTFYLILSGSHWTYATGVACRQGTLTPPDTWSRPFVTCICSTCWDQSFFRSCRYFSGLCSSNIHRYFLDFAFVILQRQQNIIYFTVKKYNNVSTITLSSKRSS